MIDIIYEDDHIMVVRKPAGIESQSGKGFAMDMASMIKNELALRQRQKAAGTYCVERIREPYVGVIHRLDRPVSGVMVYAKTKKAAAGLSAQVQKHEMKKRYYALVCGVLRQKKGTLTDYLVHDKRENKAIIVEDLKDFDFADAKQAVLHYEQKPLDSFCGFSRLMNRPDVDPSALSLVEIDLITGRHHQIRAQFAHIDCPILGDTKYNPDWQGRRGIGEIGLCAYRLEFIHPVTKKNMKVFW